MNNDANYEILDHKRLCYWFKFEWAKKCKSWISNEPCDAQTVTHRAVYNIWTIIEVFVGLANINVTQMQHSEDRIYLYLFSC